MAKPVKPPKLDRVQIKSLDATVPDELPLVPANFPCEEDTTTVVLHPGWSALTVLRISLLPPADGHVLLQLILTQAEEAGLKLESIVPTGVSAAFVILRGSPATARDLFPGYVCYIPRSAP